MTYENTDQTALDTTSRRSFLTTTAVAGTMLALAIPAAATSENDPIFAAIERYRTALEANLAAKEEYDCCRDRARTELGSNAPSVVVVDVSRPPNLGGGQHQVAYSVEQLDGLCPPERFPDINQLYRRVFDEIKRRCNAIMGASADALAETYEPLESSADALAETTPTSLAGVFALLAFLRDQCDEYKMDDHQDRMSVLFFNIEKCLRTLTGNMETV
jgi:hypothetical protein